MIRILAVAVCYVWLPRSSVCSSMLCVDAKGFCFHLIVSDSLYIKLLCFHMLHADENILLLHNMSILTFSLLFIAFYQGY